MLQLLQWKSNTCGCVCRLRYSACNAHASYCVVVCDLSATTMFFHIIIQTTRFSEEAIEHKISF